MSGFGFEKIKKPGQATPTPGKLDLTGINLPPPTVSPEQEKGIVEKAESLGFSSREPASEITSNIGLDKKGRGRTVQYDTVFIKGPIHVIEAFRQYTANLGDPEEGAMPLWKGLKQLLESQK